MALKKRTRRGFDAGKRVGKLKSRSASTYLGLALLMLVFPSFAAAQLPCFNIHVTGDDIYCSNWKPNAALVLAINPGGFMASILTNESGFGIFVDVYDIQGGQTVTITDGVSTVTYIVANVVVTKVDTCNDTVSGTADPGIVNIAPWLDNRIPRLSTVVDPSGHWLVDFKTVGFDLLSGDQAFAEQRTDVYPIYCSTSFSWFAGDCVASAGEIVSYSGEVHVNLDRVQDLESLNLQPLDEVTTFTDGHVEMKFGESTVSLAENSSMRVAGDTTPAKTSLDVLYGSLKAKVRNRSDQLMEVATPQSIGGVRGTEMLVEVSQVETRFTMLEHDADVSTPDGSQSIVLHELEGVVVTAAGIGVPYPVSPNEIEGGWERFVISVASPVNLYVTDPLGRHVGCTPAGDIVNEIPGAVYSGPSAVPEIIDIPEPAWGCYLTEITAVGSGEYHLTFAGMGLGDWTFFEEYTGTAEPDKTIGYEMYYELVDEPLRLKIDIKPRTFPNDINLISKGRIPVAVLTDGNFDAQTVDWTTVRFGAAGTEAAPVHHALEDVDRDGDLDLILQFRTQDSGIRSGDTSAYLRGFILGKEFEAYDSIIIVGFK